MIAFVHFVITLFGLQSIELYYFRLQRLDLRRACSERAVPKYIVWCIIVHSTTEHYIKIWAPPWTDICRGHTSIIWPWTTHTRESQGSETGIWSETFCFLQLNSTLKYNLKKQKTFEATNAALKPALTTSPLSFVLLLFFKPCSPVSSSERDQVWAQLQSAECWSHNPAAAPCGVCRIIQNEY